MNNNQLVTNIPNVHWYVQQQQQQPQPPAVPNRRKCLVILILFLNTIQMYIYICLFMWMAYKYGFQDRKYMKECIKMVVQSWTMFIVILSVGFMARTLSLKTLWIFCSFIATLVFCGNLLTFDFKHFSFLNYLLPVVFINYYFVVAYFMLNQDR